MTTRDTELVRDEHTGVMVECPKPRTSRQLAEAARLILGALAKVPPRVRFEQMVASGLIDSEGRLRRKYGGEAP